MKSNVDVSDPKWEWFEGKGRGQETLMCPIQNNLLALHRHCDSASYPPYAVIRLREHCNENS